MSEVTLSKKYPICSWTNIKTGGDWYSVYDTNDDTGSGSLHDMHLYYKIGQFFSSLGYETPIGQLSDDGVIDRAFLFADINSFQQSDESYSWTVLTTPTQITGTAGADTILGAFGNDKVTGGTWRRFSRRWRRQ